MPDQNLLEANTCEVTMKIAGKASWEPYLQPTCNSYGPTWTCCKNSKDAAFLHSQNALSFCNIKYGVTQQETVCKY